MLYVQDRQVAEALVPKLVSHRRAVSPKDVLLRCPNDAVLKSEIDEALDTYKDEWRSPNFEERRALGPPGQDVARAQMESASADNSPRRTVITSYTVPEAIQITKKAGKASKDVEEALLDDDGERITASGEEINESVCTQCKSAEPKQSSPFIGCDACPRWFHVRCTGDAQLDDITNVQQLKTFGEWRCPVCVEQADQRGLK